MSQTSQTVFITGAGSGIGRGIALEMAKRGAYVVCTDISAEAATETADEIGKGAEAHGLDVVDRKAFEELIARVWDERGVDVLVNNAGIAIGGQVVHYEDDDWEKVLDVNIRGVVNGVRSVYRRMIDKGAGHIVNVASLAGLLPAAGVVSYCASKHAVVGLSLSLRLEAEDLGVRVSVVTPGVISTAILKSPVRKVHESKRDQMMRTAMPMKHTEVSVAARDIADGIERNEAIIFTPTWVKRYHRAWRFIPSLVWRQLQETARRLRAIQGS